MKVSGLTRRWIINVFAVIIAVLVIISLTSSYVVTNYYRNSVRQQMISWSSGYVPAYFSNYLKGSAAELRQGARSFVENFTDKDKVEVWVLNGSGEVLITSSGFQPDQTVSMPDYQEALRSPTARGEWIGRLDSGERVIACTSVLTGENGNVAALRYLVSMEDINLQLTGIIILINVLCFAALLLVVLSSTFFIRSIVHPVEEISAAAKLIAKGNYTARIDKTYDDEIGALCDTINYMAEQISDSDRMKNDFISTVSHELRTPLTAISGWSETLDTPEEMDSVLVRKGLKVIASEAMRLSHIVEELLDFSKIQSGRLTLRLERIDLLDQLDEAIFVFRDRAKRDGVTLSYSAPDYPVPAQCDPRRIQQVFVNILDNALKYTSKGGHVTISAHVYGKIAYFTFADTGCGISPEDLPFVFDKFYKANQTVRGSGIGLAVVKEIVNLHHGELDLKSKLGEGTTLVVALPVLPPEEPEDWPEQPELPSGIFE